MRGTQERRRRNEAARLGARVPHEAQADLQPPLAVASRRRRVEFSALPAEAGRGRVPSPQPAGATPPDILALQGVSLSFGGVRALAGVDLTVPAGSITGIIGP